MTPSLPLGYHIDRFFSLNPRFENDLESEDIVAIWIAIDFLNQAGSTQDENSDYAKAIYARLNTLILPKDPRGQEIQKALNDLASRYISSSLP